MKNKIAIQMDDIKTIDFDFDSSFIIGLEGQKRNYDLFYYHPDDLFIDQGEVKAKGFFLELFEMFVFDSDYGVASSIFYLFVLFPSISVSVRRLHDISRTGWWLFISFLPIIGTIILLIFHINDSHKGENIYGKNPKF